MHAFEIKPLLGIGPVELGMERAEVREMMIRLGGGPMVLRSPDCDTFFDGAFQVNYDGEGRVEFIETASHNDFQVLLDGHALHKMPAEDVVAVVSNRAAPVRKRMKIGKAS